MAMQEKILDIKQVQQMLGLSERTIFRLLKAGKLSGFKAGREWRFTEEDVNRYIQAQREQAEKQFSAAPQISLENT